jgi:hypothetical protein
MKRSEPFSDRTLMPVPGEQGIDDLLHDYFRAKLPEPWPAPPATHCKPKPKLLLQFIPAPRQIQRARRYLALAATVALFLVGYWTLATAFPTVLPSSFLSPFDKVAEVKPTPGYEIEQTPSGPVQVLEQKSGNKTIIRIEKLP